MRTNDTLFHSLGKDLLEEAKLPEDPEDPEDLDLCSAIPRI